MSIYAIGEAKDKVLLYPGYKKLLGVDKDNTNAVSKNTLLSFVHSAFDEETLTNPIYDFYVIVFKLANQLQTKIIPKEWFALKSNIQLNSFNMYDSETSNGILYYEINVTVSEKGVKITSNQKLDVASNTKTVNVVGADNGCYIVNVLGVKLTDVE